MNNPFLLVLILCAVHSGFERGSFACMLEFGVVSSYLFKKDRNEHHSVKVWACFWDGHIKISNSIATFPDLRIIFFVKCRWSFEFEYRAASVALSHLQYLRRGKEKERKEMVTVKARVYNDLEEASFTVDTVLASFRC